MNMRSLLFAATVIVPAVSTTGMASDVQSLAAQQQGGPPAASQCLVDLMAFDEELAEFGFGVLPPDGYDAFAPPYYYGAIGTPRQVVHALRESARIYALDGDEETCQKLLSTMRGKFDAHQALVGPEGDDPRAQAAWRRVHLSRAQALVNMTREMRADIVIGAQVRNLEDKKLGTIKDLVLDPGKSSIAYVLVAEGGFLGFGDRLVAIRWQDLRAAEDHEIFVLDVSESAFDEAPVIEEGAFDKSADKNWRQTLDKYWDENIERAG